MTGNRGYRHAEHGHCAVRGCGQESSVKDSTAAAEQQQGRPSARVIGPWQHVLGAYPLALTASTSC